ncbi:unnamed protein product, partial [Ostreobium quekettii]
RPRPGGGGHHQPPHIAVHRPPHAIQQVSGRLPARAPPDTAARVAPPPGLLRHGALEISAGEPVRPRGGAQLLRGLRAGAEAVTDRAQLHRLPGRHPSHPQPVPQRQHEVRPAEKHRLGVAEGVRSGGLDGDIPHPPVPPLPGHDFWRGGRSRVRGNGRYPHRGGGHHEQESAAAQGVVHRDGWGQRGGAVQPAFLGEHRI